MVDVKGLCNVTCQLQVACTHLTSLLASVDCDDELLSTMCDDFVIDEVKHIQQLTIELTKRVAQEKEPTEPEHEVEHAADENDPLKETVSVSQGEETNRKVTIPPLEKEVQ